MSAPIAMACSARNLALLPRSIRNLARLWTSSIQSHHIIKESTRNRPFITPISAINSSFGSRYYNTVTQPQVEAEPDALFKRIDVEVKGHDHAVLNSYQKFVTAAAQELDISLSKISTPPKHFLRRTLLKSVHIYKKHRVQYEVRTHYRTFEFKHLTGSTADTFLEYIQRNLPEGVAMKVTKHQIEALPSHIKPPDGNESSSV